MLHFYPFILHGSLHGDLHGSLHGILLGKGGDDALENVSFNQFRRFTPGIMPAVFKKLSHPGTKLIRVLQLLP
jgi:hypothetical protein